MPHLTLSFGRGSEGQGTSGDLSAACLGLACFVAWALAAGLGMPISLASGGPLLPAMSEGLAFGMRAAFSVAFVAALIFVGASNQRFLRFYVSNNALVLALGLSLAGTACAGLAGMGGTAGAVLSVAGPLLMGAGAGLLLPLWGTAFAKSEFATITLNTATGAAMGVTGATVLIDAVPAFVAVPVEALLACASVLVLWSMTPIPYYRRRELPVFHALRVNRLRFLLHLGIPVAIFGAVLGVLGAMCVRGAFCTGDVACDLLVGASCALCLVLFVTDVALMRDEAHWDTLFRYMLPVVGLGLIGIPLFHEASQLGAVFLMTTGLVVLLVLLWVVFSDMSQEFRLSPLFVFGIGGGLMLAGAAAGALLVPPAAGWEAASPMRWTGLAMGAAVCLMLAGAINPRKRDVVKMLAKKRSIIEVSALNQMVVDAAEAQGAAATDEQLDATLETVAPDEEQPDEPDEAAKAEGPEKEKKQKPERGSFYRRCEEIADQFMLSRRETEVLFLLAKGHKAGFIEEKLCVSRSTAKTHINHIYKKMDIHTQQELLNMVEDRPRPHSGEAPQVQIHHGF